MRPVTGAVAHCHIYTVTIKVDVAHGRADSEIQSRVLRKLSPLNTLDSGPSGTNVPPPAERGAEASISVSNAACLFIVASQRSLRERPLNY